MDTETFYVLHIIIWKINIWSHQVLILDLFHYFMSCNDSVFHASTMKQSHKWTIRKLRYIESS